jgi:dynein heavy chain 1
VLATDQHGEALVTLPDALGRQAFEAWIKALPDSNSPSWIGLPATAESQLKRHMAARILAALALLQGAQEADYAGALDGQAQALQAELSSMASLVGAWSKALPGLDQLPGVPADSLSSATSLPAERWLAREVMRGTTVLRTARDDLQSIR